MKIDKLNAVIIKELLQDGRKSFTDIAQLCGESKEVVASRYRQMTKQGIIVGATIQNSCACYDSNFAVAFYVYTRPCKAEAATRLLRTFPKVIEVYPAGLNPSINTVFTIKSIAELEQTRQAIKELPDVLEIDTQIWTGMRNTPHNLSCINDGKAAEREEIKNIKIKANAQIDGIDKHIIESLVLDSRIPFSRLAKDLDISTDTVSKRYEKLKNNRYIKPVIRINPTKIGYSAFALFKLTFSEDSLTKSIEMLSSMPDFNLIHKISGKFDVWSSLMIKDVDQFTEMQEKILHMDNLTNMEVSISKLFNAWPLQREFISTF
jgi:Lrp/AsnC family transcriptional regulator for asnA, asnC and gidA